MTTERSCSWCHAFNPTTARWCAACGHRADVPRLACDCPPCRRTLPISGYRWAQQWREGLAAGRQGEIPF